MIETLQGIVQRQREALRVLFDAPLRALARVARAEGGRLTATLCREHLVAVEPGDTSDRPFGVAFDVGTTTVVGTLVHLGNGEVEAVAAALNRQATYGGDVISRIAHTMSDPGGLETLQQLVLETLNGILTDLYRLRLWLWDF